MKEITLFYATNNKSKLHNMYYRLKDYPIKVVSPDDLGIHLDIEENGKTAIENALIKATEYYKVVGLPTIAGDSGLYIEGLREEEQPGLYVRRVNGKDLSDDEMIEHYTNLARKAGCECFIKYFTGIALITGQGRFTKEFRDTPLKLSPVANSNKQHRGNPLDSISIIGDGRFFNELSDEERVSLDKQGEREFTDFIISNIL